ncbi:MAG: class I SAM-dependent methyltransferase [Gemmatimonadales bacterium]
MTPELITHFGPIDIYLFDQLLRGRITPAMRVLDAGSGAGRNLIYLLKAGFEVFAADGDPAAIASLHDMAATLAPHLPADNFRAEPVEGMSFPAESVEVVLSVAVLHFARDTRHFDEMLQRMWKILKPGGLCFCRLASSIGMEEKVTPIEGRWFRLPDGSERFLVDEAMLLDRTRELGAELLDPLKTTLVQGKRAMTTWIVRKPA